MSYYRRLPIYLLLDCSESMAGDAFTAMEKGLAAMMADLRADPMALETAFVSLLTFASTAKQVLPLTEAYKLVMPTLPMGSGTALGAGLQLLRQCMTSEVVTSSPTQKGDYKPIVFILTDGAPTDAWEQQADYFKSNVTGKKANVIAVALGPDADADALRRITGTVLTMNDPAPGTFKQFFKWVSASISSASQKIATADEKGTALPNLPPEVGVAQAGQPRATPVPDRFKFVHIRCGKSGQFAVQRFEKVSEGRRMFGGGKAVYQGVAAHPVNDFDFTTSGPRTAAAQTGADQLQRVPPCPYCGNQQFAVCDCGKIFCIAGPGKYTCPWCNRPAEFGGAASGVGTGAG